MVLTVTPEALLKHRAEAVVNGNLRYEHAHVVEQGIPYAPHFWLGFTIMNGLSSVLRQRSENRFAQAVQKLSPNLPLHEMSLSALAGRVMAEGCAVLDQIPETEMTVPSTY